MSTNDPLLSSSHHDDREHSRAISAIRSSSATLSTAKWTWSKEPHFTQPQSLLSSLQMAFRTLAIEKRSSEVWQVLGAAKAELKKYGDVWDKLGKQLDTAVRRTVEDAGKRTRAVERRLRDVETLEPLQDAAEIVALAADDDEGEPHEER